MEFDKIADVFDQTLNFCDTLDDAEVGVYSLTDGEFRMRDTLRLELSQFLLYLGNANTSFEEGEIALLNLVFGEEHNASYYEYLGAKAEDPSPENSLTLVGFISGDRTFNNQNGTSATRLCDLLVKLYETMGDIMVAMDENNVAAVRKLKFISRMKTYIMKQIRG